jgi:hypothetical protein
MCYAVVISPLILWDIRPPRMAEVQILHRYTDVIYLGNAGAIAEEKISARTSCTRRTAIPGSL